MLKQIGKRLATVIPSLIGVVIVTFLLTRVLPGDAASTDRCRSNSSATSPTSPMATSASPSPPGNP
jgi:ABC-type dipeptide/oligopeptide/nickel transport system permease component